MTVIVIVTVIVHDDVMVVEVKVPEGVVALNHVCRTSPEHERLDDDDEQVVLRTVHAGWCLSRCLYAVRTAPAAAVVSGTRHTMEEATRTVDDA